MSIGIPNFVTGIGPDAFHSCEQLTLTVTTVKCASWMEKGVMFMIYSIYISSLYSYGFISGSVYKKQVVSARLSLQGIPWVALVPCRYWPILRSDQTIEGRL